MTLTAGRSLALALLLPAVLFLSFLGRRDAWAPDEPRYAEVARETLVLGHWWHPHSNGQPYPDKPPLYFWAAAAAGALLGGVDELAARLPSALSGLVLVAATWALARRLAGPAAALVAAWSLATTWLVSWMARRVALDVMLAAFVAIAILAAWSAAGAAPRRRLLLAAACGVAAALGVMTKGPVTLLFIAGALLPLLPRAWRGDGRALVAGLAAGGAAFALALAAWLVPARALGGYDALAIVREHVVERASEGRHHVRPAWYYLVSLPADLMPWTPFVALAALQAWRRRRSWDGGDLMLLGWLLVPLLTLSFIVEKRNLYVLPLVPAAAVLLARELVGRDAARPRPRWPGALVAGAYGLVGVAAVALAAGAGGSAVAELSDPRLVRLGLAAVGLTGVAAAGLALEELRRKRTALRLLGALAVGAAAIELSVAAVLPAFEGEKSARGFAEAAAEAAGDGPLGMYPAAREAYVYYSGRFLDELATPEEVVAWLGASQGRGHLLVEASRQAELPPPREIVLSDEVGHKSMLLLRYGPRAGDTAP